MLLVKSSICTRKLRKGMAKSWSHPDILIIIPLKKHLSAAKFRDYDSNFLQFEGQTVVFFSQIPGQAGTASSLCMAGAEQGPFEDGFSQAMG